jgi:GMP synthase-like glutamine amidotransferase
MRVLVIRHHDVDSAGFIGEAFEARGATLDTRLFPDDGPLPLIDGFDAVVVLGAISSVNDADPWIAAELAWLTGADQAGVPILGICFGGQALCVISGGRVEKAPRQEIGWTMIDSVAPDRVPLGPWVEFHGDRCLLPVGAQVLAANDLCVQAFTVGKHLGVQFHPEVDGAQLKRWLDKGADTEVAREGIDPAEFLAETIRQEPAARTRAARLVTTFLSRLSRLPRLSREQGHV